VARLAVKAGIRVSVCSLVDPDKLKGDAALAYADWQKAGIELKQWPLPEDASFDLALDALLGTGIDREVGGEFKQAIDYLNRLDCPKLAVDIPSGLNADTGQVMGSAVQANSTVTFVGRKRGMYTADGPDHCGQITFDDLAVPAKAASESSAGAGQLLSTDVLAEKINPRPANSHKGSFGHVLAVGGIRGMSGAVRLCGEAALRSGAGRVTLVTDAVHAGYINMARPELMVKAIDDPGDLPSLLAGEHVIAVGPGLGLTDWSQSLLTACLDTQAALVIDADGLNLLAQRAKQKPLKRENWILTPHPAEAARLLGCEIQDIQRDRVNSATAIANRYGASVVLKGCGTVIAGPSGEYAVCPLGNPGMATAGSGDVLTGIIAALLAQGLSCADAAKAGALAHAKAGDFAVVETGEMALVAGDIIDFLPDVWSLAGL
jgi:NAD(P)H-hydrate epimerase